VKVTTGGMASSKAVSGEKEKKRTQEGLSRKGSTHLEKKKRLCAW